MFVLYVLFCIFVIFFQWIFLKYKKARKFTYIKVFSLLTFALIYAAYAFITVEKYNMSAHHFLSKFFIPVQEFLTLKGMGQ